MLLFKLAPLDSVQSGSSLQSLGRLRRGIGSLGDIPALRLRHGPVRRQLGVPVFARA